MSTQLIPFTAPNGQAISTLTHDDGSIWFLAADACKGLGLENVSRACARLDRDEKDDLTLSDVTGRQQKQLIISEAGFYRLAMRSRKLEAQAFQRWVTHDVLPQIRKTGRYEAAPLALDQFPELKAIASLVQSLAEVRLSQQKMQEQLLANQKQTIEALTMANRALESQMWLTIHQYLVANKLEHTMTRQEQADYGKWLIGYCQENGHRAYEVNTPGQKWAKENQYHVGILRDTLEPWLLRRHAQPMLAIVPPAREGEA